MLKYKGTAIEIQITWNCDFDFMTVNKKIKLKY